jgi:putative peptidoglycan lipid II flippase
MNLLRAAATVGCMTLISRISGFVRDILIAAVLGTGFVADAFFVAFKFPNLFRRFFAEGAFNSAFIPLFARLVEGEGLKEARRFAEEALALLLWALLVLTLLAEIAMPFAMYLLAPGFSDTPEKFDLSVELTRIAFPYLIFVSLVALYSGVLNSLGRFAAAAFAPALLNVILIVALLLAPPQDPDAGRFLVCGVALAGLVQLVLVLRAAGRAGITLKLRRPRMNENMRRLLRLGVPGLIAGGITQINLMIGTIIASLQDGAVSFLYYADRIYQLPLGVIGVAVGVVLLPELARRVRAGDERGAQFSQNRACELSLFLTLPAAVALLAIPYPIVSTLFERGAFDHGDSLATAGALGAFALGLPAFVLVKVFSPAYFARENTKTPMIYAAIGVTINIAGSLALFYALRPTGMGHVGIAFATSAAAWANAGLLLTTLLRRGDFVADDRLKKRIGRITLAALVMGAALFLGAESLAQLIGSVSGQAAPWLTLILLVCLGGAVFALLAHLLGAARYNELRASLNRRPTQPAVRPSTGSSIDQ